MNVVVELHPVVGHQTQHFSGSPVEVEPLSFGVALDPGSAPAHPGHNPDDIPVIEC